MVSSLRRNLQSEHVDRLIDLTLPGGMTGAAAKPVATLAARQLRQIDDRIEQTLGRTDGRLDDYSIAHLEDARRRIEQAPQGAVRVSLRSTRPHTKRTRKLELPGPFHDR